MAAKRSRKTRKQTGARDREAVARKLESTPAAAFTPTSGTRRVAAKSAALGHARAMPKPLEVVAAIVDALVAPLGDATNDEGPRGAHVEEATGASDTALTISSQSLRAIAATDEDGDPGPVTPRIWEHRSHPRVAIAVDIDLASDSHFFSGLSGDVSEGGVFVQTYRDIKVGSNVAVEFALPGGHVTAHGKVRWHRENSDSSPPGVGISFDELSESDRELIHRFCEARAPLYYDIERV